jgi:4-diphosphocytidyl-2C-methyl-D-erythritol kinase
LERASATTKQVYKSPKHNQDKQKQNKKQKKQKNSLKKGNDCLAHAENGVS